MQKNELLSVFFVLTTLNPIETKLVKHTVLPACVDLKDSRPEPSHLISFRYQEPASIIVGTTTFVLSGSVYLPALKSCDNAEQDLIEVSFGYRISDKQDNIRIESVYYRDEISITQDGHFFDGNTYHKSGFCIQEVSQRSITVKFCKPACNSSDSQNYCVPKCCAPDEIIGYWAGRCRKLKPEMTAWSPESSIDEKYRGRTPIFQRNPLACVNGIKLLPFRFVEGLKLPDSPPSEKKENIKLEVKDGKLRLFQLTEERQWEDLNEPFCIDGFVDGPNKTYRIDEDDDSQVAVICPSNTAEVGQSNQTITEAWIYAVVSIIASLFLVAIIVVYCILPEKRNFHGLVVLSYTASTLCSYLLYTCAHFITLFPNEEFTGIRRRGPFCMIIAIASHYFLFASFAWLTVLNIDLWRTFSSLHMISPMDKRLKDFSLYSVAAWGVPLLLIISFITVDEIFREPLTQEIVPDYATSCSVASWSRGYYVYAPLSIILFINGLLTTLTFCVLFRARRNASKLASNGPERYSATIFIKLFCITGVVWFCQMLSWLFNGENKPWYFLVIDILMHLQAVALFLLFCCNERTLQKIQDEYPRCSRLVNGIRWIEAICCCQSNHGQGKMEAETKPMFATPSRSTQSTHLDNN